MAHSFNLSAKSGIFRFCNLLLSVIALLLCLSGSAEARSRSGQTKVKDQNKTKVWVLNNDYSEEAPFDAENINVKDSFFIFDSSLTLGQDSIANWTQRINYPFYVTTGPDVVLHLQTEYFSRWENINPLYAMQLNLEIPAELFKSRTNVDVKNLKGFLAWAQPRLMDGKEFYLEPVSGHLEIWKVKKGVLKGRVNLRFWHEGQSVQVYGKIRCAFKSREAYVNKQENLRQELYQNASSVGDDF